ncbi:MAG: flavin reductase family protein [Nitrosopumilaceae archaeon]
MERKVANKAQRHFVTGVSMITSNGYFGKNVMAAEWTMQISYDPLLIAIFLHESSVTLKNIRETREFGVNVASDKQSTLVNIAGGYSGSEIDKLKVKNSFTFLKSKYIKSSTIANCAINAECQLFFIKKIGDHVMVVGKVVAIRYDETKKPLLYHTGRYYQIGSLIEPFRQKVKVNKSTFDWFLKEAKGKFILKCTGAIIKSDRKVLFLKHVKNSITYETIPYLKPKRGVNYFQSIQKYLKGQGLKVRLKPKPIVKRLVLENKNRIQRVNFVLFEGTIHSISSQILLQKNDDALLKSFYN